MRLAFALLDHRLASTTMAVTDDDFLLHGAVVMRMAPAEVPAAVAVLDNDLLADVAVTHAVMIATGLDLHLHVLRERGGGERGRRKRQRRNGGSRKRKFSHVLLLQGAGPCPRTREENARNGIGFPVPKR